ncbi:tetratricopeptide repeat protein [Bacillus sp. DNRA2]|uniref:tetratricopeptide repeat protein n=1 Tax=Bacillus sp. DNRA2 TaxID=2723053 RepID=UPI00145CCB00|nr:tetratricopeptide repeat protein [Bacillus sp. DNRA2]NMD70671.1 tetratricopeptide repeat protein [Bacillus sp. DNRA2]
MNKRDQSNKDNNIILFPNLEKRLLEKGLDQLQRKNFSEAINLLSQANELNPDDEDINLGLVVANFEAGNLAVANQRAKHMLQLGIGEYFTIVDMYIMILVQQNNYAEIVITIEALLEEREVPAEKLEHFMKMLHFSRKMAETQPETQIANETLTNPIKDFQLELFSIKDPGEQVHVAGQLANSNVRASILEISEFLSSDQGDPFFKTILLTVLKEQEYDKEVIVRKYSRDLALIPESLFEVHNHPDFLACIKISSEKLENDDPILLDSIKQLMERYFFLIYPFRIENEEPHIWASAFHFVASSYFGQELELEEIANFYEVKDTDILGAIEQISTIEEISSP